ncbi:carboxymuconolactone decarboxylase family protein [Legionella bozemanae]|uniref:Putative Carboxymuconolactone decarboxylase n=1 Tax=Legionella bozemanae TaxID=447 RepID=A0A0W0R6J9_LEGBO|nr:carboxymuconolactone decarboxylase family protein [Legionella bozemanae]KTC66690.1 putative Carboxymuconolactone decarboxylase [Legionella bozemanae]STO33521.1 Argininosuccinate synthase [Legionella bozemanae]
MNNARIDFNKFPDAIQAIFALEKYVNSSGLEKSLLELVKLRASQINGCAYCVDMHTADAKKEGESDRRLHAVVVWRETPFFTPRERAALAWTEAVTLLSETHAPDALYNELLTCFNEKEVIDLTMAIVTINSWNRMAVSFRKSPS